MKKTYINPEIENVSMSEEESLLETSFDSKLDNENKISTGDMLSRRGSAWEDDFEDEEY